MTPPQSSAAPLTELEALPRWVPPVVFAVLTLMVFRAYLLADPGMMLLGQDTLAAGIMFRGFFVEQFRELHRLPLWNPYLYGGVPTIEAGSGDILYPGAWLHFLLPLTTALAWKLILHVFLAGLFMYAAARAAGVSRWVALFAGVVYQLGPNLVSLVWGGQDGKLYVITLFPAALWLLISALARGSWIRFLWLGAVAGLMLVAHPQLAYYAYLALAGYGVFALLNLRSHGPRVLGARLAGGVLAVAVALSVAAVVLLPMYGYLRNDSPRAGAGRGYEYSASYSLHPEEVVNFLVPTFSGVDQTYWGRNPLKHNSEYAGVLVLCLGLAGVLSLRGDRRRWGFLAISVVTLLYALGSTTPAFRLFYGLLPGVRNFRAPSLATFVALAAWTLLAVLLLERTFRDRRSREGLTAIRVFGVASGVALVIAIALQAGGVSALGPWFGLFGESPRAAALEGNLPAMVRGAALSALWCGIAAGLLAGWRTSLLGARAVLAGLMVVAAVDLLIVDSRYVEVVRYSDYFPDDPGIQTLRQALGPGERVFATDGIFPTEGHLAVYRIPLIFGYHGNQLRWYDELTRRGVREGVAGPEAAQRYLSDLVTGPVLRLLATRVVILPGRFELPGFELMGGNEQLGIYRNRSALPAASVIPRVSVEPDSARQLARIWDPGFDPSTEVLAFEPIAGVGDGGGTGGASIVHDGADSVAVRATTSGPSVLLLSRNWHPSWVASVDGRPVVPARVDYALLGVPLSAAGTYSISFAYRPAIVRQARSISLAGWAVVLLGTIALLLNQRRKIARA